MTGLEGGFTMHDQGSLRDHHATLFLTGAARAEIDALRARYDPEMARQIGAHTTLLYPSECPRPDELGRCVERLACDIAPFEIRLTRFERFPKPWDDGVYAPVEDPYGSLEGLRRRATSPPFARIDALPHVTIIHPRTAGPGVADEFLALFERSPGADRRCDIDGVDITAFDGERWVSIARHEFRGSVR